MFYLTTHLTHFIYGYKAFFYMHNPIDRIAHTKAFVTPVVKHWLEREIAPWEQLEVSGLHNTLVANK